MLLLSACKLIDQTTFDPEAGKPPVIAVIAPPVAPTGPPALVRIPLDPPTDWSSPLREAVTAARRAKPTVVFDVVAVAPSATTGVAQSVLMDPAAQEAALVAQAIADQGVAASRIQLLARPEPLAAAEVRVFVR